MEARVADPPRAQTTCFHHRGGMTHRPGKPERCLRAATRSAHGPPPRIRSPSSNRPDAFGAVLVLAVVLNALTAGSASHRARHDHRLRELAGGGGPLPRCDAPAAADREAASGGGGRCSRPRQRRAAQWALELRQTVGKTLCPFAVCEDRDENRRPRSVHKVVCLEAGCRCTEEGSYRCVQVVDEMEVLYLDDRDSDAWISKRIKVEVGCVCAANVAQPGSTSFPDALDQ